MTGERNLWSARLATDLRASLAIVAALAVVPLLDRKSVV